MFRKFLNRVLLKYPTPTSSILLKTLLQNIFDRRYPPCEDLDFVLKVIKVDIA